MQDQIEPALHVFKNIRRLDTRVLARQTPDLLVQVWFPVYGNKSENVNYTQMEQNFCLAQMRQL